MKLNQLIEKFNEQEKSLGLLTSPSWLSGLITVVVSMAVVIGTFAMMQYNGSQFQLLKDTQELKSHTVDYDALDESLSLKNLVSNSTLFILWAAVGLVAYTFTMSIWRSFRRAVDFEHELDYVHTDRNQMVRHAVYMLVFRLIVLIGWFIYIQFTLHVLLPYVTALAITAAGDYSWLYNILFLAGATGLLALALHLHVVLLRLVLLKPRVFSY